MDNNLACVGLTILDILGRPIDEIPPGGKTTIIQQIRLTAAGTAAGPAVIAARLGVETALVGAIGKDDMGGFLTMALEKNGVDVSYLQRRDELPTAATMLAVKSDGQRPNFHAIGSSILLEIDGRTRDFITNSRYIHWGGVGTMLKLDGGPGPEILKEARQKGATVTCDFIAPNDGTLNGLKLAMPHVDYFMPSLEEAMEVSGTKTPEDTAKYFLDLGAGACIFKWGAKGSLLATRDGQTLIPAFKVEVVDTTGCGDSYCAGFIAGLSRGFDVEKSCRFATAVSALVATGLGSDAGVVNFEETVKAMATFQPLT
ncbi:MAG: kinase [Spirochaetae bacterium HGW-Spirochaetae-1]|jgi:sugar/nucleoside kinase (ribokinase family)|nr:MAG: kinase [Spirochaetae bacterium HGW-Spirochaetae-1]